MLFAGRGMGVVGGKGLTKLTRTALLLQRFADFNASLHPPPPHPPCDGLLRLARCIATPKSIFPKTREGDVHPFLFFCFTD